MYGTITRQELEDKLENEEDFELIEVLDREDYEQSHIKGAINIPLSELGRDVKDRFDEDRELVVYCADINCGASPNAAEKLDQFGFENVYDYEGGKEDWREAGNPMSDGN